jgi:hypothetical protein
VSERRSPRASGAEVLAVGWGLVGIAVPLSNTREEY